MYNLTIYYLFGYFDTNGTRVLSGEGLGLLGNLEELEGIIGDVVIVPNRTNVEKALASEGLGILGILGKLGNLGKLGKLEELEELGSGRRLRLG